MYNFLLGFFLFKKAPPPSTYGRNVYFIDHNLENIYFKQPSFSPIHTNYRMTTEEFEDLMAQIHQRTSGFFLLVRVMKLIHILIGISCIVYLGLILTVYKNHSITYMIAILVIWILFGILMRIYRMRLLKKAQESIELYLIDTNHYRFHKRRLHWKITPYAQYLECDLNYSPYTYIYHIGNRFSTDATRKQSSPTGHPNPGSVPLLDLTYNMHSPTRRASHASHAKSTRSNFSGLNVY